MLPREKKTILITGCSSGIGYATAHFLREKGWHVFASCRQEADCARLRQEGFDSPLIDYADPDSIKAGFEAVLATTGGRLDALYNNGAHATPGLVEDIPRAAYREIFEVNVYGYFDLIRLALPVMRAQGHGRILNCSSVLGLAALRGRGPYIASKFALEGLTEALALELKNDPIEVVLIEPGPITARIRQNSQPHFEKHVDWKQSARRHVYEKALLPRLYDEKGGKDRFELGPEAVAEKIYRALSVKKPKPRYYVTTATYIVATARRILTHRAFRKLAQKL